MAQAVNRGLRWASITFDMLSLAGLGFAIAVAMPLWLPWMLYQAWRQKLVLDMPDPHASRGNPLSGKVE